MSENTGVQPSEVFPRVICKWTGSTWEITIKDNDGKNEITRPQMNLLSKLLTVHLKRRFRHLRIAAKGVQIQNSSK
jgi:hypothetical protein